MEQVNAVYSVPLANLKVYSTDSSGAPADVVYESLCHDQIQVSEKYLEKITYPSGSKYGIPHHVNEEHEITVRGLLDLSYILFRNVIYVVSIEWLQADVEDDRRWIHRNYFGSTYRSIESGGSGASEITQGIVFRSQFYRQATGAGGGSS